MSKLHVAPEILVDGLLCHSVDDGLVDRRAISHSAVASTGRQLPQDGNCVSQQVVIRGNYTNRMTGLTSSDAMEDDSGR
jgi:hypothetical protein